MGKGKPRGMRAGGKLKDHRRLQRWNDKDYNKAQIKSEIKLTLLKYCPGRLIQLSKENPRRSKKQALRL